MDFLFESQGALSAGCAARSPVERRRCYNPPPGRSGEMADAGDLKSSAARRAGSSPASGTISCDPLPTLRPAQLERQLVGGRAKAEPLSQGLLPVAVPDQEEVAPGRERPAQPGVEAQ